MRRRRWIAIAASVLCLLLAMVSAAWNIATQQLVLSFDHWTADMRRAGWTVERSRIATTGWPFVAIAEVSNLSVSGGDATLGAHAEWRCPTLTMRLGLFRPNSIVFEPSGTQTVTFGPMPPVAITATRAVVIASGLLVGGPNDISVEISGLRALPMDAAPDTALTVAALKATMRDRNAIGSTPASFVWTIKADAIQLPTQAKTPLGRTIAALSVETTATGPFPLSQRIDKWLAAWRDDGGALQLQKLDLAWGPLRLVGAATIAMDEQLQPMGAGTARVSGYDATLDALSKQGMLGRSAATATKAVLALLADTPVDGGPPEVEVPLTLQYRTLSVRQIPLWRVPELDWPVP